MMRSQRGACWLIAAALAVSGGCRGTDKAGNLEGGGMLSAVGVQTVPRQSEPPLSDVRTAGAEDSPAAGSSRWAKWWGPFGKPQRIPLPRTDLDADDEEDDLSLERDVEGF